MGAEARRLDQLDATLPKRRLRLVVAGFELELETLDDLDDATFRVTNALSIPQVDAYPHYGVVWPGAVGLCEYLVESGVIAGKDVLELGCGLAVPSMIARRAGARRVVASDRHPLASRTLERNLARNRIEQVTYRDIDWRDPGDVGTFDLVIASDVIYEPWHPGVLAALLPKVLRPGGQIVLTDQGRRYLNDFVTLVEGHGGACELTDLRRVPHGGSYVDVMVLAVRP